MAVYAVTGKLGSGKTLVSVSRIADALSKDLKVATNLDINLKSLCAKTDKSSRIIRIPDKPTVFDLECIGWGYDKSQPYDEEKFGLIVLDELGTWFNSRGWNDKSRQDLVDYFLHIRKRRWHVYFIIQDISIADKQLRDTMFEMVAYCRRMDRIPVPIFSPIAKLFGGDLRLPKIHLAIVKYGTSVNSLTIDKWMYKGVRLYSAYDTQQIFSSNYSDGAYSVLPPGYQTSVPSVKWSFKKIMQMTRIYMKRGKSPVYLLAMFALGAAVFSFLTPDTPIEPVTKLDVVDSSGYMSASNDGFQPIQLQTDPFLLAIKDADYLELSLLVYNDVKTRGIVTVIPSGRRFDTTELENYGYSIQRKAYGIMIYRKGIYHKAFTRRSSILPRRAEKDGVTSNSL